MTTPHDKEEHLGCRVGITTNPPRRRMEWFYEYPTTMRNWEVLAVCTSKAKAQEYETEYARIHGCDASPGGPGPNTADWHVYHFEY